MALVEVHVIKLNVFLHVLIVSIMAGHDSGTQHQFTGIAKYFNSYTITGRRNVSHDLLIEVIS